MKKTKKILLLAIFMYSALPAQNTTILFLRDGSIIQGTITHEKPNKIFLKTEMGFVQIKPEDIIGREDLAKKGDLTYMSDQIDTYQSDHDIEKIPECEYIKIQIEKFLDDE